MPRWPISPRSYGPARAGWRWGEAHVAVGKHQPFAEVWGLDRLFNVEVESAGGPHTLNRGLTSFGADRPFANIHAAGFRAIYDLADLDRSLYIQSTGQSGHPLSRHYRSFAGMWARGEYITIPTREAEVERVTAGRWRLCPANC